MSAYLGTQVLARLRDMLREITIAGGYHTDIGQHVGIGDARRSLSDAPGCVLIPGRERAAPEYGINRTIQPLRVICAVNRLESAVAAYPLDSTAPWVLLGAMVRDVRKCLETRDATLAGLVEHIGYTGTDEPNFGDSGGELVAVDVLFEVRWATAKGAPDSPL